MSDNYLLVNEICMFLSRRKITSYRPINVSVQSSVAYWHLNFLLTASIHFGWMISSTLEHRGGIHVITYSLDLYVPLRNIRWRSSLCANTLVTERVHLTDAPTLGEALFHGSVHALSCIWQIASEH